MSTERNNVGWHWHLWTQWSEPYQAVVDGGNRCMLQKRRCEICNLHQFKNLGI